VTCEERLVLGLAGDIINALRDGDSISAYRCVHTLEGYVKRNKCGGEVIDAALKLLVSAESGLSESARYVLKDIISLISKLKKTVKTEGAEKEKPKGGFKHHKRVRHRR